MKKILLLALSMLMTLSLSAQRMGVVGGLTTSNLAYDQLDASSVKGFHAGLTFKQPLFLGFTLQPSVLYTAKGSSLNYTISESSLSSTIQSVTFDTDMKYLEVPVQLQWGLDLIVARPYIFVEPFVGYALSGEYNFESLSTTLSEGIDMSQLDGRLEYGFGIGAGLEIMDRFQVSFKRYWNYENLDVQGMSSYLDTVSSDLQDKKSFDGMTLSVALFF